MGTVQDICRICLQETDPYSSRKIDLRKLCILWKFYKFDKMDASFYRNHLICDACISSLKALKTIFFNAKNSQIEILQEIKRTNLARINLKKMSRYSSMKDEFLVCRLCLKVTKEVALYLYDNSENILSMHFIRKMFLDCKVHVDFKKTINPVSCYECWENIQTGFSFRKNLEKVNEKIVSYAKALNKPVITREDLQKVISLYNNEDPIKIKTELDLLIKKESTYYTPEDIKPKIEPESPNSEKYFNPFKKIVREGPIDDLRYKPITDYNNMFENESLVQKKIVLNPYHESDSVVVNPLYEKLSHLLCQNNITLTRQNKITKSSHDKETQTFFSDSPKNTENLIPPNHYSDENIEVDKSFREVNIVEELRDENIDLNITNDKEPVSNCFTIINDVQIKKEIVLDDEDIEEEEVHIKREVFSDHENDGLLSDDDVFVEENNFLGYQTEQINLDAFPNLDLMIKNEPIHVEDNDVYDIHYIEHFDESPPILEPQVPCKYEKQLFFDKVNSSDSPKSFIPLKKKRGRPKRKPRRKLLNSQNLGSFPDNSELIDQMESGALPKRRRGRPNKELHVRNLMKELSNTNVTKNDKPLVVPKLNPVAKKNKVNEHVCEKLTTSLVTDKTRFVSKNGPVSKRSLSQRLRREREKSSKDIIRDKEKIKKNSSDIRSPNRSEKNKNKVGLLKNPLKRINTRSLAKNSSFVENLSVADSFKKKSPRKYASEDISANPSAKKTFKGGHEEVNRNNDIDEISKRNCPAFSFEEHMQENHNINKKRLKEDDSNADEKFNKISPKTANLKKELVINLPKLDCVFESMEAPKPQDTNMPELDVVAENLSESKPDVKSDISKPETRLRHLTYFFYKCELCGFKTYNTRGADMHKARHANNSIRSYNCPDCPFKTNLFSWLKLHVKKEHPEHNLKNIVFPGHCFYCRKACVLQIKCRKCKNVFHFGCFSKNVKNCKHEEEIGIKEENVEHNYSMPIKEPNEIQKSPKNPPLLQKVQPIPIEQSTPKTCHSGRGPLSPPVLDKEPNTLRTLQSICGSSVIQVPPLLKVASSETDIKSTKTTEMLVNNESSPVWTDNSNKILFQNMYTDLRVEKIVENEEINTNVVQNHMSNECAGPPLLRSEVSQPDKPDVLEKSTNRSSGLKKVLYPVRRPESDQIQFSTSKKQSPKVQNATSLMPFRKIHSDFERVQSIVTKHDFHENLEGVELHTNLACFDESSKQIKQEVLDSFEII